jgi:hypothetical protein
LVIEMLNPIRSHWVAQSKAAVSAACQPTNVPPYFGLSAAWDVVGGTDTGAVVEAAEVVAGLTVVAGAEVVAPEPQEARIRTQEMRTPRVASTHFPFTDGLLIKLSPCFVSVLWLPNSLSTENSRGV